MGTLAFLPDANPKPCRPLPPCVPLTPSPSVTEQVFIEHLHAQTQRTRQAGSLSPQGSQAGGGARCSGGTPEADG